MPKTPTKKPQAVSRQVTKTIKKAAATPAKTKGATKGRSGASTRFPKAALRAILRNIPAEWRGTTFKNSALLGREKFASRLLALVARKGAKITEEHLVGLGNAEDYLRVSSNVSSVLECYLATQRGRDITRVFTFASRRMAIVAVLLTSGRPVRLYTGKGESPFTSEQQARLALIGCSLTVRSGTPVADASAIVLATGNAFSSSAVDAVVQDNVLYINNPKAVVPAKILVIRKRMATPLTTPAALALLESLAGVPVTAGQSVAGAKSVKDFYAHL